MELNKISEEIEAPLVATNDSHYVNKNDSSYSKIHQLKILNKNTHLLFGHWAALDGFTGKENITALDTGCAWGNKLTAMRLEDLSMFSCDKLN